MDLENKFEDLLNDFINKDLELDNDKEAIPLETRAVRVSEIDLEPCVCKGVTYRVPRRICKPDYRFESLSVNYDIEGCESELSGSSVILKKESGCSPTIFMELNNVSLTAWDKDTADVFVLLYRVGTSYPLFIARRSKDDFKYYTATVNLSQIKGEWQPGEYFLLIANAACDDEQERESCWDTLHSHVRYSFRVLPDGNGLEHPTIKNLSMKSDGLVKLDLQGATSSLDEYSLQFYSSNWVKLSEQKGLYAYGGKLKTQMFSQFYWTDDTYFLVLVHNEEPCCLFMLTWENSTLKDYSWSELNASSPFYVLSKYLQNDKDWLRLCKVPGCGTLRKAMVGCYGHQVLNKWRVSRNFCRIKKYTHMAIAVADGKYQKDLARSCAKLLNTNLEFEEGNCEALVESKNAYDPFEDMKNLLVNCEDKVICLHHLSALVASPNGKLMIHLLEEYLQTEEQWSLILMGTSVEISQILESSPVIERYITNRFYTEPLSVQEQVHFLQAYLGDMQLEMSVGTLKKLVRLLTQHRDFLQSWGQEELLSWWKKEICPRFINRVLQAGNSEACKQLVNVVEEADLFMDIPATPKDEFAESVRELNEMVGLDNLKQSMTSLFNRSRFDKARKEMGLPVPEKGGYHMIFTGNPGTGKTTVAKLVGKIYHSLGLLSKGGVIFTERSKLVGRYLGETEKNMVAVLEQAKGNVLFIDEAYSLCDNNDGDRKDYGCRVLESLLTVLSKKDPDMIVIMAGYEKEMNLMLEMNPGMKGRFPYKFNFEDYQVDELYQIACNLLERAEYVLTPEADALLQERIQEAVQHKDAFFHNARWVEQFILDGVVSALSDRLMNSPLDWNNKELLQTIEEQDIELGYQKMKPQPVVVAAPRKRIGFVA